MRSSGAAGVAGFAAPERETSVLFLREVRRRASRRRLSNSVFVSFVSQRGHPPVEEGYHSALWEGHTVQARVSREATILIVDDEPGVREVLEEYLAGHGYTAIGAESAVTARTIAARTPIDLALIDIHMPGEDGLSLSRHLRERYPELMDQLLRTQTSIQELLGVANHVWHAEAKRAEAECTQTES